MIKHLQIKNFKSIKELEFDCSRVNLFIGEPNTGKSNILEAVGAFSMIHNFTGVNSNNSICDYIRVEEAKNLFYNNIIDDPISIRAISSLGDDILSIVFNINEFLIECSDLRNTRVWIEAHIDKNLKNNTNPKYNNVQVLPIRFYRYKNLRDYKGKELDFLNPPYGDNLLALIRSRKAVKEFVLDLFKEYNYKFQAFEDINKMYFVSEIGDELISLPFHMLSDTLLRLIFYFTAIELSKDASIIFEEPEAHVFPFYNKYLAERIANYNTNQFFIATHNPTFLANLIEQTPNNELKVFITYYENYQTKLFLLSDKKLMDTYKIFGTGIFSNLDKIVKNLDEIIKNE